MSAVSKELEALTKQGTTEGASELATKLDEMFLAVKAALEARLERDHQSDTVSV